VGRGEGSVDSELLWEPARDFWLSKATASGDPVRARLSPAPKPLVSLFECISIWVCGQESENDDMQKWHNELALFLRRDLDPEQASGAWSSTVYVDGSEHTKPGRKHQALHSHAKMQFANAWQYCLPKQQTPHAQLDSSLASWPSSRLICQLSWFGNPQLGRPNVATKCNLCTWTVFEATLLRIILGQLICLLSVE